MNEVNFYSGSTVKATIDDNYIRSGTLERSVGLISESLDIDTFTFYAYSESELHPILLLADSTGKVFQTSDGKYITVQADEDADPTHFAVPGQRLMLYFTDGGTTINLGEFFVEDVEAVGKALYRFRCQTILGIMGKQAFSGGMYTGNRTLGSLVTTLFNIGMTHSSIVYDNWIDNTQEVYGYIPYGNKKDALMSLLFAFGYVLTWDPKNGNWLIEAPDQAGNAISDSQILTNGTLRKLDRASTVELLEHTYFQDENTELEVIFSNMDDVTATADTINWVVLDKPYYGIQTTRDPVVNYFAALPDSTAGYVGFVGKGIAKARPYIHQTTLLTAETESSSGRTLRVDNEGLVTTLNSKNVLQRLVNLQNAAKRADIDYYPDLASGKALKLTDQISFTDALGKLNVAHLSNLKLDLSGRVLFKVQAITDFVPGPFGQNINEYVEYTEVGNHYWTVPDGITEITVILGASGEGGSAGYSGTAGEDGTLGNDEDGTTGFSGAPGKGGEAGTPGAGGKIYTFTATVTPGDDVWILTDAGGNGGEESDGALGGASVATLCEINGVQYSSDSGVVAESGYTNPLSGNHFGGNGEEGFAGADGGSTHTSPDGEYVFAGSVDDYSGGQNGLSDRYNRSSSVYFKTYGGGGGGAAYGDGGYDGRDGTFEENSGGTIIGVNGGRGRQGGWPDHRDQSSPGRGGAAGHGGGGGGGGGGGQLARAVHEANSSPGSGGPGGSYGYGGQGGDGWAVILY